MKVKIFLIKNKNSMLISFNEFLEKYKDLNKIEILEDDKFFYLWKLVGIPSSFGKEKSVLDILENNELENNFTKNQMSSFNKEQEYGLLNRLDNDTSGLLYFAKNQNIYNDFKIKQKNKEIEKVYYAKVDGIIYFQEKTISYPIMHKNKTKMIAIKEKKDIKKARGKQHLVETTIKNLGNNWLEVKIRKGIRHQIRVHLASIDLPIVGDKLYGNGEGKLQLFSVGLIRQYSPYST